MSDFQIRKGMTGGRREGRRSLSAYGSHARGTPPYEGRDLSPKLVPASGQRSSTRARNAAHHPGAAFALAMVLPLLRGARRAWKHSRDAEPTREIPSQGVGSEGARGMKRKPSVKSLETVSLEEAAGYLDYANGDELDAAYALALDRNRLDGSMLAPDDAEVHHALFLLCRARGVNPPSYDEMRVELRRRLAA
jgi:hypothetical protein